MKFVAKILVAGTIMASLAGCAKDGELDLSSGVGISVTRTGCPTVAIPDGTGDVTLFNTAGSQDANAIERGSVDYERSSDLQQRWRKNIFASQF